MKRMLLLCLLLCLVLTACGADEIKASVTIPGVTTQLTAPSTHTEDEDVPNEPDATTDAEADTTIKKTTTTSEKVTTSKKPTTSKKTTTTKKATTTKPKDTAVNYRDVEPYQLPVANPDKEIYDKPEGTVIDYFGSLGYYKIVAEAKDSRGYTWGLLSTGGWTLVYFDVLPEMELWFSSGAGAWGTSLHINGKGEFTGTYHDSNAGDSGENHPNGSCYICDFEGTFAITGIKTAYSVSLTRTSLNNLHKEKKEWIEDDILYIPSTPYGVDGGSEFILYLPDTPVDALPEDAYMWGGMDLDSETIDCYVLYSEADGYTFYSYQ